MFKKGTLVTTEMRGPGALRSKEPGTRKVLKVNSKGVFVDNGPGNDPSGPFDSQTGLSGDLFGVKVLIREVK